jgi:hypothetical protein
MKEAATQTDPATLPDDVKRKLLAVRDALIKDDCNEAFHHLYSIACPSFDELHPWERLEGSLESCFICGGEKVLPIIDENFATTGEAPCPNCT